jgi:hypothetical protein
MFRYFIGLYVNFFLELVYLPFVERINYKKVFYDIFNEVLMWKLRLNYVSKVAKTNSNRKYRFTSVCDIEADRNSATNGNLL